MLRRDRTDVEADLGDLVARPAVAEALALLGRPGSRHALPTPDLVVEAEALAQNISTARRQADAAGMGLRPHAKTHKCAAIARLQLAAGAQGICVAKLGEAEALSAAGIGPLLVTSPVHPGLLDRLARLRASGADLMVVVDEYDAVEPLAAAAEPVGGLGVLIDLDVGLHRTGVADPEAAGKLAQHIERHPALRFHGVQAYGGHWQHVPDPSARHEQVATGMALLSRFIEAIAEAGGGVTIRSGGGTGTFASDCRLGVLNDLQIGSYALMDRQYNDALAGDAAPWRQALFVQATVVSANHEGFVTVDAGLKAFATDAGAPLAPASRYTFFGDEHGHLAQPSDRHLQVGDRVALVPPHCDPTVDRYDVIHLVQDDTLVDIVKVDARGCSQ